jgi:hypothetical protein
MLMPCGAGAFTSFLGFSTMTACVVSMIPVMEHALSIPFLVTLRQRKQGGHVLEGAGAAIGGK